MTQKRPNRVVFTGNRHDDHVDAVLCRKVRQLRYSTFQMLLELILARSDSESGWVESDPVTIHHLRRAFDKAGESGREWIETGVGQEYRIALSKEDLAERIAVTTCFFELEGRGVVTPQQSARMRELFRVVPLHGHRRKKLKRNRKKIRKKSRRN